ncbi:hypothetical protein AVEN_161787-1 [Araneus ventricosus]|uniref:Alpha-carbonic anhydrase domain-containing protein n=1 Tax=Araneus ventricosus TaxID=182803 RepID=A0A4Y2PV04_ARAVE|nr:hypothetical protein AVEN_161787-1 [Araneus ventricosus]
MLQFFIICAFIFINDVLTEDCEAEDQYSWSYHGPSNGPYYWEDNYPDCRKKAQSPIEIRDIDIINLGLPKLQYNGFNTPITKATVRNLGWTGKLHFSLVIATTTALATINRMDYVSVSQGVTHAHRGSIRLLREEIRKWTRPGLKIVMHRKRVCQYHLLVS